MTKKHLFKVQENPRNQTMIRVLMKIFLFQIVRRVRQVVPFNESQSKIPVKSTLRRMIPWIFEIRSSNPSL